MATERSKEDRRETSAGNNAAALLGGGGARDGGVYIVISTGIRMANGQWLKRVGPFEIGEKEIGDIEAETANWRKAAEAGREEIEELARRLKASDEFIAELERDIEKLHPDMDDG